MDAIKLYNIYNHVAEAQALWDEFSPVEREKLDDLFGMGYTLTYCLKWAEAASRECLEWLERELKQSCRREVHCGDFYVWYSKTDEVFYVEEKAFKDAEGKWYYLLGNNDKGFDTLDAAVRYMERRRPYLESKVKYS